MRYLIMAGVMVFALIAGGCQKQEIDLLNELNEKLRLTQGDLEKAKATLKEFIQENQQKIKASVDALNAMPLSNEEQEQDKAERLARFNSSFYDKNGLHQTIAVFEKDKEFQELFESFKRSMQGFFQDF